jgi:hypothetical protein
MEITINDERTIFAIQEQFNALFPYLKIEFFSKPHIAGGASPKSQLVNDSKKIGECRTIHKQGSITIVPSMIVSYLEQLFNDIYGLSVQVFRKSGNAWLETTVTDSWTLKEQNDQGEELTKFVNDRKK